MKTTSYLLFAFLLCSISSKGQANYYVGSSNVSIEPDSSIFSVTLAGYGVPREGRFSLTWKYIDQTESFTAITGLNGKFYGATVSNQLLEGTPTGKNITWKIIGKAKNAIALAALNGKLFAISNNKLWVANLGNKISWKKVGKAPDVKGLTALNNQLYATNTNNDLLSGSLSASGVTWSKVDAADHIISMTSDGTKIYTLNRNDTLWSKKPGDAEWKEIGRNNASTFDIHVKHLVVVNDRLYAVSPDNKLYIGEHSTNSNLSSTAMAIRHHEQTVVIVGVDVTGFNYSLINEIKQTIFKRRNIPATAILINASHTHFAPVTQAWLTWGDFCHYPDSIYLNKAKAGIIHSIELALDNMAPANIYFGRGVTHIGHNRRSSAKIERPYDGTLDVLKIEDTNKNIKSVLFLTACHPVYNLEGKETYTLNANYPSVARKLIEDKTHAGNAIFIQGCAGDINPVNFSNVQTGQELATDVLGVLNNNMHKLDGEITYAIDKILIPVTPWSVDSITRFKNINIGKVGNVEAEKNVRWANLMLKNYKDGTVEHSLPLYIQTINIGDWKFVGLSREAVTEYGLAIRKLWPEKTVTVAGYCNDVSSYLPISWHIQTKTYEGYSSSLWYGQHGIPPVNVLDIVIGNIKSLNK